MKRTPFKSRAPVHAPRDPDRVRHTPTVTPGAFRAPQVVTARSVAAPKTAAHRNPHLLSMAKGKPCLLCQEHGVALCSPGSTVAAHSNLGIHGKGMSRKANDEYTAWLGDEHHRWLDQGKGSAAQRERAFMTAHLAQVRAWRAIAFDTRSAPKDRAAAQWALALLNATPTGAAA